MPACTKIRIRRSASATRFVTSNGSHPRLLTDCRGCGPMQAALAEYELRRNEASSRDYDDNITMARFTPFRPEVLGLRAAVRNQPQQATAFTKAVMGMIDRDVFFNPENLQRVMAG